MIELFSYQFFQNALIAGIFGGIICSVIGVFIFAQDMPFLGIALSHAAFTGAIAALLLGVHPLLGALILSVAAGGILGPVTYRNDEKINTSIGILFSAVMGLGFLLLGMLKGNRSEGLSYIWGSILTVTRFEALSIVVLTVITIGIIVLFYPVIKVMLYNKEIAFTSGIKDRILYYGIIAFCGAAISLNLVTVGGLLVFSLLICPAAAACRITQRLGYVFVFASIFGVISCLAGIFLSYALRLPCGALIVLNASLIYLITYLWTRKHTLIL